jgi:hypothetical protein
MIPMSSRNEYRRIVLEIGQAPEARTAPRPPFRESVDTLVLGSLSVSVGVVLLVALLAGFVGIRVEGWNRSPVATPARYRVPAQVCGIAAVAGQCLGLAGILLARRRRAISPLSTLGTVFCLVHICLFFIFISLVSLF